MHRISATLRPCLTVPALLFLLLGVAMGQHSYQDDVYVTVENPLLEDVAQSAGVGDLGDSLYQAQEGVHNGLTSLTGLSVPHYYAWLCFGSQCLGIDPFIVNK